jgi:hypothetical protein
MKRPPRGGLLSLPATSRKVCPISSSLLNTEFMCRVQRTDALPAGPGMRRSAHWTWFSEPRVFYSHKSSPIKYRVGAIEEPNPAIPANGRS